LYLETSKLHTGHCKSFSLFFALLFFIHSTIFDDERAILHELRAFLFYYQRITKPLKLFEGLLKDKQKAQKNILLRSKICDKFAKRLFIFPFPHIFIWDIRQKKTGGIGSNCQSARYSAEYKIFV